VANAFGRERVLLLVITKVNRAEERPSVMEYDIKVKIEEEEEIKMVEFWFQQIRGRCLRNEKSINWHKSRKNSTIEISRE
jgi:hypothetical protein